MKTLWWVEPNHMPGAHRIRASVWYISGRTIEVSHLVTQRLLDSVILPRWYIGQIIFSMQSQINGMITEVANNDNQ